MVVGVFYGIAACMIWGFVYLVPLVLPTYDPAYIAAGRFVSFGLLAGPLVWLERRELAHYTFKDWIYVAKLGVIGNIAYFWCLTYCIQYAGAPFAGMCMALVPVLVALVSNWRGAARARRCPLRSLPPASFSFWPDGDCQHHRIRARGSKLPRRERALLVRGLHGRARASHLDLVPDSKRRVASCASRAISPDLVDRAGADDASLCRHLLFCRLGVRRARHAPFGRRSLVVRLRGGRLGHHLLVLGIVLWNAMSQRLPTALGGQLIVFETIFAVIYAHALRMAWPAPTMVAGLVLLLAGVLLSLRAFRRVRKGV